MADPTNQMQVCGKCGARQRDPEARFCQLCGELLPAAAAARRRRILFIGSGAVIALLVVAVVLRLARGNEVKPLPGGEAIAVSQPSSATRSPISQKAAVSAAAPTASLVPVTPTVPPTAVPATLTPQPPTATLVPSQAPSSTLAALRGYVDRPAGPLDLRSGPHMAFAPLGGVRNGSMLDIVARTAPGDWLLVRTGDGIGGWVPTLFVHTDGSLLVLPILAAPPSPTRGRPSPTITRTALPLRPTPRAGPNPRFRTDKPSIRGGDCATLRWDVENVQAVYLDGNAQGGHDALIVCPPASHTYLLTIVQTDGRRVDWPLAVEVSGAGTPPQFLVDYRECLPHELWVGQVKGRAYDRKGNIIVGALVEILVEGQAGVVPVGRTNEDGWYEFNLKPGHDATFVRLEINGQSISFYPHSFTVTAKSRCYQRVDFRQR